MAAAGGARLLEARLLHRDAVGRGAAWQVWATCGPTGCFVGPECEPESRRRWAHARCIGAGAMSGGGLDALFSCSKDSLRDANEY